MYSQNLEKLAESDVLSISLDQGHLYFEMVVLTYEGTKYRLAAWNVNGTPLEVTLGALHFLCNLTNVDNVYVLGELEGVSYIDHALSLEGDFGDITIKAAKVSVEELN